MTEISVIPAKAPSVAQQIGSEVFRHAKGLRDRAPNGTQEIARLADVKTEQGELHCPFIARSMARSRSCSASPPAAR